MCEVNARGRETGVSGNESLVVLSNREYSLKIWCTYLANQQSPRHPGILLSIRLTRQNGDDAWQRAMQYQDVPVTAGFASDAIILYSSRSPIVPTRICGLQRSPFEDVQL